MESSADFDSEVSDTSAVHSPIQNLPSELLIEIFEWFLFSNAEVTASSFNKPVFLEIGYIVDDYTEQRSSHPTLKLSWVCSRWRKLITTQPSFWSSIFIDTSDVCFCLPAELHGRREIFLRYISLSGNAPLSFFLVGKGSLTERSSDLYFIMDTLLDNIHRWGTVYLAMSLIRNWGWLERFLEDKRPSQVQLTNGHQIRTRDGQMIELHLPNLSHLRVQETLPVQLLTACPKLQMLEIDGLRLSQLSLCDLTNMTTLHVNSFYGTEHLVDVICRIPLLEELHIGNDAVDLSGAKYDTTELDRVLVLDSCYPSNLTTLSVSVHHLWIGAWKGIIFPHLKSLAISTECHGSHELELAANIMAELAEMLSFSFSHAQGGTPLGLQDVTFRGTPAPMVVQFLRSQPLVSQLALTSTFGKTPIHDEVFTLLSAKPFVIPRLRTLSLAGSSCEHYTYTDPYNLDTYSFSPWERSTKCIPPEQCRLAEDISSMIKVRKATTPTPETPTRSNRFQHLVLGYGFGCMNLESLQDQLGLLGVTVTRADDTEYLNRHGWGRLL